MPQREVGLVGFLLLRGKRRVLREGEGEGEGLEGEESRLEIARQFGGEGSEGLPLRDHVLAALERIGQGLQAREALRPEVARI